MEERVMDCVRQALRREKSERTAFVGAFCNGHVELERAINERLAHYEKMEDALDEPAAGQSWAPDSLTAVPSFAQGRILGKYSIERELGRGGMGIVYLARRADKTYEKQVAIKVLNAGDSEEARKRFEQERRILAALEHPQIGRIIDADTTDEGHSYLVMDYIDGMPVTAFAAANDLTLEQRLRLFLRVCDVVAFAHRNLILHRDLKPSNILVDREGTPHLIDFGIAKSLTVDGPGLTRTGVRALTLQYASPEQIRGKKHLTVGTDVYSLGLVLFEVLTGQRPIQLAEDGHLSEHMRAILEDDPTRACALRPELSGDIDAILGKALRKEAEKRYLSVAEFRADIDNHLKGLPISAYKGDVWYRTVKLYRRNRTAVISSTLVAASLIAGVAGVLWQARIANQRYEDVRSLAHTFIFDLDRELDQGVTASKKLIVSKGLTYSRTTLATRD